MFLDARLQLVLLCVLHGAAWSGPSDLPVVESEEQAMAIGRCLEERFLGTQSDEPIAELVQRQRTADCPDVPDAWLHALAIQTTSEVAACVRDQLCACPRTEHEESPKNLNSGNGALQPEDPVGVSPTPVGQSDDRQIVSGSASGPLQVDPYLRMSRPCLDPGNSFAAVKVEWYVNMRNGGHAVVSLSREGATWVVLRVYSLLEY